MKVSGYVILKVGYCFGINKMQPHADNLCLTEVHAQSQDFSLLSALTDGGVIILLLVSEL